MEAPFQKKTWRRALGQTGVILILAVGAGISSNQLRSNPLPLVGDWSPQERLKLESGKSLVISLKEAEGLFFGKRTLFLDARPPELYREGHIQGARNLPWQQFDDYFEGAMGDVPMKALIIAYCDGEQCALSEDLARELYFMGYEKVRVLVNGWTRWVEAGLPVEGPPAESSEGH